MHDNCEFSTAADWGGVAFPAAESTCRKKLAKRPKDKQQFQHELELRLEQVASLLDSLSPKNDQWVIGIERTDCALVQVKFRGFKRSLIGSNGKKKIYRISWDGALDEMASFDIDFVCNCTVYDSQDEARAIFEKNIAEIYGMQEGRKENILVRLLLKYIFKVWMYGQYSFSVWIIHI